MIKMNSNETCVICLDSINDEHMTFHCNHKLHDSCFQKYLYYHYNVEKKNISCPICRTPHKRNIMFIVNYLLLNDKDNKKIY